MRIMEKLDAEIREKTAGEAGLRFYRAACRVMNRSFCEKSAQAAPRRRFTGVGLGQCLDSRHGGPILFQHRGGKGRSEKMERIRCDVEGRRVGVARLVDVWILSISTKASIHTADDLKKDPYVAVGGDPLAETFLKTVGVSPVSPADHRRGDLTPNRAD
jgi:hypothetical protein